MQKWVCDRKKGRFLTLTLCCLACGYFMSISYNAGHFNIQPIFSSIWNPMDRNYRNTSSWKDVAISLASVVQDLRTLQSNKNPPSKGVLDDLQGIMAMLDPMLFANATKLDIHATNISVHAEHSTRGNPSSLIPIHDLVSFILKPSPHLTHNYCSQYLSWTLRGIAEYYPTVAVYVAELQICKPLPLDLYSNVRFIPMSASVSDGRIWTKLISMVTTPYVFVGRDLFHFTNLSLIERLVDVLESDKQVQVAGGASRNLTGHWRNGCFQTQMHNYVLQYTDGYYVSMNDCMVCDYLSGPFLARTTIFQSVTLNTYLHIEMIFPDFFLRLKNTQSLAVLCPDAMHFANADSETLNMKETWVSLARKWELNYIIVPKRTVHAFSCEDSEISCSFMPSTSSSFLLPPCCLKQYSHAFAWLTDTGAPYEIDNGSLLGAVKFQDNIPWDRDGDTVYLSSNYTFWLGMKSKMAIAGMDLVQHSSLELGGLFVIWTPDTTVEMYSEPELSDVLLPPELRLFPTLTEVDGVWVKAPTDPGLYARNRYGEEIFRHSQSYKHYNRKSSFSKYTTGIFLPCQKVNHHACLDRFPTDGNLAFKTPW